MTVPSFEVTSPATHSVGHANDLRVRCGPPSVARDGVPGGSPPFRRPGPPPSLSRSQLPTDNEMAIVFDFFQRSGRPREAWWEAPPGPDCGGTQFAVES